MSICNLSELAYLEAKEAAHHVHAHEFWGGVHEYDFLGCGS